MNIGVANNAALVSLVDQNKDGILTRGTEVNVSIEVLKRIDTNNDKLLSTKELESALGNDMVTLSVNVSNKKTNLPAFIGPGSKMTDLPRSDETQGLFYGGGALGVAVGAGIGALVAKAIGLPASKGAEVGFIAGGAIGIAATTVYVVKRDNKAKAGYPDPIKKPVPDDVKQAKRRALTGLATGGAIGAAIGAGGGILLAKYIAIPASSGAKIGALAGLSMGGVIGGAIADGTAKK